MNIPLARPDIGEDEIRAVIETMKTGWVTQGKKVKQFEGSLAKYCGVKHGVAANSGTATLHIALAALDIKKGDEVITTPLSCVATTNPILYLNAKPVFVDIESTTLNIDPTLIEKKITSKTKAILPVHLFGHPVDLDPLIEVAEKHGLYVVEDAAEALGAKYKGKKVGSFGRISCFSFYADKHITTIEGGVALTNDTELAEKMRMLRSFGMHKHRKFFHPILGYNYKMPDVNASIGLVQLQKLDRYIDKRRENTVYLNEKLSDLNLRLPREEKYAYNVYYVYHILAENENQKEKIVRNLEKQGIETRPLLSFIPSQPAYNHYQLTGSGCQNAKNAHKKGFYISNSPQLAQKELDYMTEAVRRAACEP